MTEQTSTPAGPASAEGVSAGPATSPAPAARRDTYHHGDLRATLVREALRMLEAGEVFSLRGVARAAGVSQTAPYRHFPDRDHLEAAVAAEGFRDLERELRGVLERAVAPVQLADLAVVYVEFALRRPALFAVMFETSCGDDDERLQAVASVHRLIQQAAATAHPASDPPHLSMAAWSLAHGLAVLLRDGKLADPNQPQRNEPIETRVRAAFAAILTAR